MTTFDASVIETEKMIGLVEDGVGWMIYNNPARRNAISFEMTLAIPRILGAFQNDPNVSVIVVTGAGDKAFVSGADISEFGEKRSSTQARKEYDEAAEQAADAWGEVDKPIIAMIRGYCVGGGLATAMRADIRIAAEGSKFGYPAARLGLGLRYEAIEGLLGLVGPAWAAEILFSARQLTTDEALRIGLINRVVPSDDLESTVRDLAGSIGSNAPLTMKQCKFAIREALRDSTTRNMARIEELREACFKSKDYAEGQEAFREKRAPKFQGC